MQQQFGLLHNELSYNLLYKWKSQLHDSAQCNLSYKWESYNWAVEQL